MLLMLAQWLQGISPEFGFLRVFQYLTLRAVLAAVTALLIGLWIGPKAIRMLTALKIGQPVRGYAMETHLVKSGTPTMGGVLILFSISVSTLLWFDLSNRFVWIVLLVTLGFGAIGWVDDWRKVVNKDPEGMRSREKYFWQSVIGLAAAFYLVFAISEGSNARVWALFTDWIRSGFTIDLPLCAPDVPQGLASVMSVAPGLPPSSAQPLPPATVAPPITPARLRPITRWPCSTAWPALRLSAVRACQCCMWPRCSPCTGARFDAWTRVGCKPSSIRRLPHSPEG